MKYDVEKIMGDQIASKWVQLCLNEDKEKTTEWLKEKQSYFSKNKAALEKFGFSFSGSLTHALDKALVEKIEDMEGCLLIVRVGSDEQPATTDDIEMAKKVISEALDGINGVRVIVAHHALDIKKISLPQLRKIQGEILSTKDFEHKNNPILENIDL